MPVTYRLYVTGQPMRVLARTPWARVLPIQIFGAAGLPLASSTSRTVSLTYEADAGHHAVASVTFPLTFGVSPGQSQRVLPPAVPPVITGTTIPVSYDFSEYPSALLNNPVIVVSYPGRTNPLSGPVFAPAWVSPVLTSNRGTLQIPVSALQGGGVYGIGIRMNPSPQVFSVSGRYSDFAITRVVAAASSARPAAPLLSRPGPQATPQHSLEIPYGSSFSVSYDVTNVPTATSAMVEISDDGPTLYGLENPFNNPNGTQTDNNGADTGSVFTLPVSGTRGTVTLTSAQTHLVPGMAHVVRVLPMSGSSAVGEASDVSSIAMDGIAAADGQALNNGYSINPSGDDGVYTSAGEQEVVTGYFVPSTSIGTFSQSLGTSRQSFSGLNCCPPYRLIAGGFVGNNTIVYNGAPTFDAKPGYFAAAIRNNYIGTGPFWTPPLTPTAQFVEMGNNFVNTTSAFLVADPGPQQGFPQYSAATANIQSQTLTANVPLSPGSAYTRLKPVLFDYDASANVGYAVFSNIFDWIFNNQPMGTLLATINYSTGSVTYTKLGNYGFIRDFVIDPNTHVAALTCSFFGQISQVELVNLTTGSTIATVPLPTVEFGPGLLAVDTTNKLFAVQVPVPLADLTDNNPLSSIAIIDENGNVVSQTPRRYNLTSFYEQNHWFGLNGTTRRGFVFAPPVGPDFLQITPFSY